MPSDDAARAASAPDSDAILEALERRREHTAPPEAEQERVPYLGFYLGTEVYGLPLQQLREVARLVRLRRIPGTPAAIAGLVNLRGKIVCALDARAILGLSTPAPAPGFLVALRGFPDPLGLVVDSIADVYSIDPAQIEPPPATWPAKRAAFFVGTTRVAEGLMGLLDLDRVVAV